MLRLVPYPFYELEKLSQWFQKQGARGLRFREFYPISVLGLCVARFEKTGQSLRCRVHYDRPRYEVLGFGETRWDNVRVTEGEDEPVEISLEEYAAAAEQKRYLLWMNLFVFAVILGGLAMIFWQELYTPRWRVALVMGLAVLSGGNSLLEWFRREDLSWRGVSGIRVLPPLVQAVCAVAMFVLVFPVFGHVLG